MEKFKFSSKTFMPQFDVCEVQYAAEHTGYYEYGKDYICNPTNYGGTILKPNYIVIHDTGIKNQTALNNGKYFHNNRNLKASAHFFVDAQYIVRSVPLDKIAWHCGKSTYPYCINENSIAVEICVSDNASDNYAAYCKAALLTRQLMSKYGIPIENVLRHHDVSGKDCPKSMLSKYMGEYPYVMSFENFKLLIRCVYSDGVKGEDGLPVPEWALEAIAWAVEKGLIAYEPSSWDYDFIRNITVMHRYYKKFNS